MQLRFILNFLSVPLESAAAIFLAACGFRQIIKILLPEEVGFFIFPRFSV